VVLVFAFGAAVVISLQSALSRRDIEIRDGIRNRRSWDWDDRREVDDQGPNDPGLRVPPAKEPARKNLDWNWERSTSGLKERELDEQRAAQEKQEERERRILELIERDGVSRVRAERIVEWEDSQPDQGNQEPADRR